jgi:hypothetical protein
MSRLVSTVVVALALGAALGASPAGARPDESAAVKLKGTATFPATDGSQKCAFDQVGDKVRERCVPDFGVFTGTPGRAGASVGWTWLLDVANGAPTGTGTEQLTLKLNFGGGKQVSLVCKGKLKPVGTRTAEQETTVGTGFCTVKSSTGFARTVAAALKGKCKTPTGRKNCRYTSNFERQGNTYTKQTMKIGIVD